MKPTSGPLGYANSGLRRYLQGTPQFQMPSYTPPLFQAPQLPAYGAPLAPQAQQGVQPISGGGGLGGGEGGYTPGAGNGGGSLGLSGLGGLGGLVSNAGPAVAGMIGGPLAALAANAMVGPGSSYGIGQSLSAMYGLNNVNFNAPFGDEGGSYGPGSDANTNPSSADAINGSDAMSDGFDGGMGGFGGDSGSGGGK